jgi:uncharacterized protein (TIGR00251 family)
VAPRDTDDLFDATPDGVVLRVHVQPKAGRDVVTGRHGDALKVRVRAAPVDGRANAAVGRQLAALFGVAPSAVTLLSGPTSRSKRFLVAGVAPDAARERLEAVIAGERSPASEAERGAAREPVRGPVPDRRGTTPGAARLGGDG